LKSDNERNTGFLSECFCGLMATFRACLQNIMSWPNLAKSLSRFPNQYRSMGENLPRK